MPLYKGGRIQLDNKIGENIVNTAYLGTQSVIPDPRYDMYISASGGVVYDDGGYRYHLFTGSADFIVHNYVPSVNGRMEMLVVGGGGGGCSGGPGRAVGGGNGGAVVHVPLSANVRLDIGTYNVTIGSGGTGQIITPSVVPATSGSPSIVSNSNFELLALGGVNGEYTFEYQVSQSGLSGQYGHNYPAGVGSACGSPGGGGAGESSSNVDGLICGSGSEGGDGYLVTTFPFAADWDLRSTNKWGAGGGGNGFGCASCAGSYVGKDGGESGGGKSKGPTTPINPAEINGYVNTGGGGGGDVAGLTAASQAGNGGSGYVGFRYLLGTP